VTVELNKGEARNALARAVCFHRLGRLRDRATEAQQYRASGLAIVTAAIALWNTVYLGRALDDSAAAGKSSRTRCLLTLPPSGGSTSISPAIIYGTPTPTSLRMDSGSCALPLRTRLVPHNVLGLSA
jgi:Tn3 transposase DDE domain-containing protein